LPEREKPTLLDRITQGVIRQGFGTIIKSVERFAKRMLRLAVLALAGAVIIVLGIAFVAVGATRWLSLLMPGWLAWLVVGIVLLLLGVVLTLMALASSR
jgi:Na+/H+-dicarboxylate symporter